MYYFVDMFADTPFIFEDCHSLEMIAQTQKYVEISLDPKRVAAVWIFVPHDYLMSL